MINYSETTQEHKKTHPLRPEFRALYLRVEDAPRHPAGHEVAITGTHSYRGRRWMKESKLGHSRVLRARRRIDFEAIQREEGTA